MAAKRRSKPKGLGKNWRKKQAYCYVPSVKRTKRKKRKYGNRRSKNSESVLASLFP